MAHYDDTTDHLTFAVQFCNAPTAQWPAAHSGDISKGNSSPGCTAHVQWQLPQILQRLNITGAPHHKLGFGHCYNATTDFLVGGLNGLANIIDGQAIGV